MSRTFHTSRKYGVNEELIARRYLRRQEGEYLGEEIPESISISRKTRTKLKKIAQNVQLAHLVVVTWANDEQETYLKSLFDGVELPEFEALEKERQDESHPIFTDFTKQKVDGLLEYNPQLLRDYFLKFSEPVLLLTHSEITFAPPISEEVRKKLASTSWGMIHVLTPPDEYREVTARVHRLQQKILTDIKKTEEHINKAIARPI